MIQNEPNSPPSRRFVLGCLLLAALVFGLTDPFIPTTAAGSYLILGETLILTILLAYWCHLDAIDRGFDMPKWLLWAIAVTGLIALPIHFFMTRSVAGAFRSLFFAILFVAAMLATAIAGTYVTSDLLCPVASISPYCHYGV